MLNPKNLAESQSNYWRVKKEISQNKNEKVVVSSSYKKVDDDQRFLVIKRQLTESKADLGYQDRYDTIDKKSQTVLSLSLLFKDKSYVKMIRRQV